MKVSFSSLAISIAFFANCGRVLSDQLERRNELEEIQLLPSNRVKNSNNEEAQDFHPSYQFRPLAHSKNGVSPSVLLIEGPSTEELERKAKPATSNKILVSRKLPSQNNYFLQKLLSNLKIKHAPQNSSAASKLTRELNLLNSLASPTTSTPYRETTRRLVHLFKKSFRYLFK